jgi:hypothetical protein
MTNDNETRTPMLHKYAVIGEYTVLYTHVVEAENPSEARFALQAIDNPAAGWIEHGGIRLVNATVSGLPVDENPVSAARRVELAAAEERVLNRAARKAAEVAWKIELGDDLEVEFDQLPDRIRDKYLAVARQVVEAALPIALGDTYTRQAANAEILRLRDLATSVIEERNEALSRVREHDRKQPEVLRAEREKTWAEAYPQGIDDQRLSSEVHEGQGPANRANPHSLPVPRTV